MQASKTGGVIAPPGARATQIAVFRFDTGKGSSSLAHNASVQRACHKGSPRMQREKQMTALRGWCTSPPATAHPPFQSPQVHLESGVRRKIPAPCGREARLSRPPSPSPAPHPNGLLRRLQEESTWLIDASEQRADADLTGGGRVRVACRVTLGPCTPPPHPPSVILLSARMAHPYAPRRGGGLL